MGDYQRPMKDLHISLVIWDLTNGRVLRTSGSIHTLMDAGKSIWGTSVTSTLYANFHPGATLMD